MYNILWCGTTYGSWSYHEALKACRQFYPGGQLVAV